MFFKERAPQTRRTFYERGTVACQKCASPVHVYKVTALADEFSVLCKNCGKRGLYPKRAMHMEKMPERRKKPRD